MEDPTKKDFWMKLSKVMLEDYENKARAIGMQLVDKEDEYKKACEDVEFLRSLSILDKEKIGRVMEMLNKK